MAVDAKELSGITLTRLANLIKNGAVSPIEVTEAFLERIEMLNEKVNAYLTVSANEARKQADKMEKMIRSGRYIGPLHGIPVAIKYNISTKGIPTTCASEILSDNIPRSDATVIRKLKEAGAVILGKLNCHEFALGPPTNEPYSGEVRNPWNLERSSGSSSSGPGAAVAASLCAASLGTDSGGSVRMPASFCGIVGAIPSYGLVSRYGVTPVSWSLDAVGPMAKTTIDAWLVLQAIAGRDQRDSATVDSSLPDRGDVASTSLSRIRIGVITEFAEGADEVVRKPFFKALDVLRSLGATIGEITIPRIRSAYSMSGIILFSEAATYHEKYMSSKMEQYHDPTLVRRLLIGSLMPARLYIRAQRLRMLLKEEMMRECGNIDVLVSPTVPVVAPKVGAREIEINGKSVEHTSVSILTRVANLLELPAISIPCGFSGDRLPVGLQIMGKPFEDHVVFGVAHAYESDTKWFEHQPKLQ